MLIGDEDALPIQFAEECAALPVFAFHEDKVFSGGPQQFTEPPVRQGI
jgi:hypothetical protein